MRHKSKNKTRPLFTLSLEMTRLVNETRLLLVPCVNSDIYSSYIYCGHRAQIWSRDEKQACSFPLLEKHTTPNSKARVCTSTE